MSNFEQMKRLAGGHAKDARFTPASRVPKSLVYRDKQGRLIAQPEDPSLSMDDFADVLTDGLNEKTAGGSLSGFGNFMLQQGHEDEVYGEPRTGGRTRIPEVDTELAIQDLYPEGTPGRGEEIDGEKSFEALRSTANQIAARRTVAQWEKELIVLEARFKTVVKNAQICENKHDLTRASMWDKRAVSLGRTIISIRNKIKARRLYERELLGAAPPQKDEYEEQPTGLTGFDDLKSQLELEQ